MSHAPASRASSRLAAAAALSVLVLTAAACAPQEDSASGDTKAVTPGPSGSASAASCPPSALRTRTSGKLTIGTDNPAYAPWFEDNEPANGKGYESAVAYAVARRLGYDRAAVDWQSVPFNNAFAPGAKTFDFDINQISITDERRKAVDFSSGYYDVRQAVIALKGSKAASATSVAALKKVKLGAQIGTTSLDVINDEIRPTAAAAVYQKNDLAVAALKNGQVDAIVLDLPTAFYITSAELEDARIVGQFATGGGAQEQFGLVLDKGSPLTACVTRAVDALRSDGTLAKLEQQWLSDAVDAPVLK
ncbi:ABC transporter substrate-binding protein [Streptomyces sp. MI02-7b]|uniref:ABC transporter substrate-binding protein n=1 Tax=Streptomyces sp. MI02-7b TaxID=462941 RepID=UPI0029BF7FBF|nr:ABC transporter substrate-binding protein [Streptomyces sp. MI02-7b]MDX3071562.1 ABC transporter substrate-binding protein [Streptomyces sp. MI02-7b]